MSTRGRTTTRSPRCVTARTVVPRRGELPARHERPVGTRQDAPGRWSPRALAEVADDAAVSAVVWHELRSGLASRFPVLSYDRRAAEWHADERARLERAGTPASFADGRIAAVAVTNGLGLVTRNVVDFARSADLLVESWWTDG